MDWNTPGYIIREETKRDKLRIEAGRRAMKYEEKIRENCENKINSAGKRLRKKGKMKVQNGKEREKNIIRETDGQRS